MGVGERTLGGRAASAAWRRQDADLRGGGDMGSAAGARASGDPRCRLARLDDAVDRFVAAYLASTAVQPRSSSAMPRSRGGHFSTSGGCCRRRTICRRLSPTRSPDKRPALSSGCLPTTTTTPNIGSRSGTTCCATTKASITTRRRRRARASRLAASALNTNVPYNHFVEQLLNPAAPGDPDGFLIGVNWRGEVSASQTPAMQAAQNTAQIFLGVNLKCNSCHDSFISKWKLKDAYALASFFSRRRRLRLYRCDVAQDEYATPAFLFPELNRVPPSASLPDRRRTAAAIFTDPRNGRLPRTIVNRMWHRLLGRGLVENPDEMDGEPWSPGLLDWLASDFVDSGYDLKRLIATIVSSQAYQMRAVPRIGEQPRGYVFRGPEFGASRQSSSPTPSARSPATGMCISRRPRPRRRGARAAARALYARMADAGQFADARARPADSRSGVLDAQHEATTLQALELVNGERLTHWLLRGARNMLGELPPPPAAVFVTPINARGAASRTDGAAGRGRAVRSSMCPARPGSGSSRRTRTPPPSTRRRPCGRRGH